MSTIREETPIFCSIWSTFVSRTSPVFMFGASRPFDWCAFMTVMENKSM